MKYLMLVLMGVSWVGMASEVQPKSQPSSQPAIQSQEEGQAVNKGVDVKKSEKKGVGEKAKPVVKKKISDGGC